MLAKDVVAKYNGKVRFVSENFGQSKLAERFHVTRYPAVFVNDLYFAGPADLGWFGAAGKYAPWREASSHERYQKDLTQAIDLVLAGDVEGARKAINMPVTEETSEPLVYPSVSLTDLTGAHIDAASLKGKVVFVEFWATWCVPCRSTLEWLGELKSKYGDKIEVLAIAVESEEPAVRKMIDPMKLPIHVIMGNDAVVLPFGQISAVPTMYIFDREGKTNSVFHGALDDLHPRAERAIAPLLK